MLLMTPTPHTYLLASQTVCTVPNNTQWKAVVPG